MGDTRKPAEETQDGDAVTTEASQSASETEPDLQAELAEAEAEAAKAEAAAATARAKVRDMRSQQEETDADADDADQDDGERPSVIQPPIWPILAKVVAAIVIVASLAFSGLIVWRHHTVSVQRKQAQEFVDTAEQGVVALTSIDFNHVKQDVQRILDNSTGAFKDDFARRADEFVKVAETSKVVAKGTVSAAAVESRTEDSAVVLVVGSEEIANAAGNQTPRAFRFRVSVIREDGQLKVSKLEMVL